MLIDDYSDVSANFGLDATCPGIEPNGSFDPRRYEVSEPKVSMLAIVRKHEVVMVQSARRAEGDKGPSWLIPQGDVRRGQGVYKGLSDLAMHELHIPYGVQRLAEMEKEGTLARLGTYVNTVREGKPKYILAFAVSLATPERIARDPVELTKIAFVSDPYALWDLLRNTRVVKRLAVCHAVTDAYSLGMIDWSCRDVLEEFRRSGELSSAA